MSGNYLVCYEFYSNIAVVLKREWILNQKKPGGIKVDRNKVREKSTIFALYNPNINATTDETTTTTTSTSTSSSSLSSSSTYSKNFKIEKPGTFKFVIYKICGKRERERERKNTIVVIFLFICNFVFDL